MTQHEIHTIVERLNNVIALMQELKSDVKDKAACTDDLLRKHEWRLANLEKDLAVTTQKTIIIYSAVLGIATVLVNVVIKLLF